MTNTQPKMPPHAQVKPKSITVSFKFPAIPQSIRRGPLKFLVWVFIIAAIIVYWRWPASNTIPAPLRNQLQFKPVFPTKNYDPASFQYNSSRHLLSFNVDENSDKVLITEQSLPSGMTNNNSDPTVLLNHLGVRYYTQTQSKLGVITIAKFWTNTYLPNGQTAILGAGDVLVLAHPSSDLSLSQWTQFFNSLQL